MPGIENTDETVKLPLPDTAVQILLRTTLAPLRKGSCQRKLTEGSFFQWRIQAVPIR